ncbi:MAG: helix-turn-helix domain-containing protein [Promicromonosporaceae bacterium]|nr:helix-turn-helix domain-containing protein [Promicromonosporaceae bacterium]
MAMTMERTVIPPKGAIALRPAATARPVAPVAVEFADGTRQPLPEDVARLLSDIMDTLSAGQAVTVGRVNTTLSTQEAAELLDISRPTMVRLLEEGRIPFTRPGTHRRVALNDVISYQEAMRRERREALAGLTRETGLRGDPLVGTR